MNKREKYEKKYKKPNSQRGHVLRERRKNMENKLHCAKNVKTILAEN